MPHISKRRLKEEDEKVLKDRLMNVLQIIGKQRSSKYSFIELFSDTEMIMFAKRLSVIYLLSKETSILDICSILQVSSSTVIRIGKVFDRGGYKNLQKIFIRSEPSFIDMLEIILKAGMPPKYGKDRWKFLDQF